jgi:hypothetical protein
MEKVGIFYARLEYIAAVRYILWPFGNLVVIQYIYPVLVYCGKKNLATLEGSTVFETSSRQFF